MFFKQDERAKISVPVPFLKVNINKIYLFLYENKIKKTLYCNIFITKKCLQMSTIKATFPWKFFLNNKMFTVFYKLASGTVLVQRELLLYCISSNNTEKAKVLLTKTPSIQPNLMTFPFFWASASPFSDFCK